MREFKFDYDKENDDLFIYSKKSKGSVEIGNIVIDLNHEKKVVGLEIINASSAISEMIETEITQNMLESLKSCRIDVKQHNNWLFIKMILIFEKREIPVPISVPNITKSSPALY